MSLRLTVTISLHGSVIDSSSFTVRDEVWLGDVAAARVNFPHAVLKVSPCSGGLVVEGAERQVTVMPGGNLTLDLNDVSVHLAVSRVEYLKREALLGGDIRLLVLTGAVVLFGMWWDTAHRWVRTNPEVASELEALPAMWSRLRGGPAEEPQDEPRSLAPSVRFEAIVPVLSQEE